MKIIFLGDCITTQQAGIHYYARNLIGQIVHHFPQHDYQVVLTKKLANCSINQIVVPLRAGIPFHLRWRQLITIPFLVNKLNPDLVIELAHFGPFFLRRSIKRITVIHDLTPITHPQWHPVSSSVIHRLLLGQVIHKAAFIITNSDFTKEVVWKKFGKDLSSILVSYPHLADLSGARIDEILEPEDQKYFLTVGTIEPRKNQVTIIRAFESFCLTNKDYKLIIAGGAGWKNQEFFNVLNQSRYRHRIILTGYLSRDQLLQMYKGATAFVFASYHEGFGVPILEASFFALPLMLARNESLPAWFAEAGMLFDPTDHLLLAKYMSNIIADQSLRNYWSKKSEQANINYLQAKSDLSKIFG